MRIDLIAIYPIIFPKKRDPKTGLMLCRFCGKPILNKNKRKGRIFYCSDECYHATYIALSWEVARRIAYERDDGKCQICGKKVGLRTAEIHHIISQIKLKNLAWEATKEIDDVEKRRYWFFKLYAMLYLDVNNLQTLCQKCHKQIHKTRTNEEESTLDFIKSTSSRRFAEAAL